MPGLSEAEYQELKFRLKTIEEEQKLKPLDQYDVAKDKKAEEIAEREGYLSDAELIKEGQIQDARGRTGGKKAKESTLVEETVECPLSGNWCRPTCPLWIEHETKCSLKLAAISLVQIANILATNLFSRR